MRTAPVIAAVSCPDCGDRWQLLGGVDEFRAWVAAEVGHPMATLEVAVSHLCCPTCDRAGLLRLVT
jgi:hypothetical protein